jgi:hypothetical protein
MADDRKSCSKSPNVHANCDTCGQRPEIIHKACCHGRGSLLCGLLPGVQREESEGGVIEHRGRVSGRGKVYAGQTVLGKRPIRWTSTNTCIQAEPTMDRMKSQDSMRPTELSTAPFLLARSFGLSRRKATALAFF